MELTKVSSEELPDIYCDLDQVLVAFLKGAEDAIGGEFRSMEKEKRWGLIQQTKGFWANRIPFSKLLSPFDKPFKL